MEGMETKMKRALKHLETAREELVEARTALDADDYARVELTGFEEQIETLRDEIAEYAELDPADLDDEDEG